MTKRLSVDGQNLRFTRVLDVRRPRSDERVRGLTDKFACHHSFGSLTSTKWRDGCSVTQKKLHFTTVFERPTFTFCVKGCSATYLHFTTVLSLNLPNLPCGKKRIDFREEQHFGRAAFLSAAFLSSVSQQLFSAALLRSSSQLFSAAFLSSSSQQLFSAAFLSSSSQRLFSAALLSSSPQQLFSAVFLQLSSCCGQGLVVSY